MNVFERFLLGLGIIIFCASAIALVIGLGVLLTQSSIGQVAIGLMVTLFVVVFCFILGDLVSMLWDSRDEKARR